KQACSFQITLRSAGEGLSDEDPVSRCQSIGQSLAVTDRFVSNEDVDVPSQPAALVDQVRRYPGMETLELINKLPNGFAWHFSLEQRRKEPRKVAGETDVRHAVPPSSRDRSGETYRVDRRKVVADAPPALAPVL